MDMSRGPLQDRILAAINNMQEVKMRMATQTQKHDMVQVMHLNDCMARTAEAVQIVLVALKERGL